MLGQYTQAVPLSHIASKSLLIQTISWDSHGLQKTLQLPGLRLDMFTRLASGQMAESCGFTAQNGVCGRCVRRQNMQSFVFEPERKAKIAL